MPVQSQEFRQTMHFMVGSTKQLLLGCTCIEKNEIFNLGDQKRKRAKQIRERENQKLEKEIKQYKDYTDLIKSYRNQEDEKIQRKYQIYTNIIKSYREEENDRRIESRVEDVEFDWWEQTYGTMMKGTAYREYAANRL